MDLDTPQSSSRRPEPIARASMPRLRSRSPPGATMLAAAGRDAAAAALAQLPPQAERPQQGRQSPRGHHPAAAAAAGAQSGAAGRLPDVGSQHGHGTDGHAAPLEDPSLQHLYYGEQAVPAAQPSVVSEPQPSLSPRCDAASPEDVALSSGGMCPPAGCCCSCQLNRRVNSADGCHPQSHAHIDHRGSLHCAEACSVLRLYQRQALAGAQRQGCQTLNPSQLWGGSLHS